MKNDDFFTLWLVMFFLISILAIAFALWAEMQFKEVCDRLDAIEVLVRWK